MDGTTDNRPDHTPPRTPATTSDINQAVGAANTGVVVAVRGGVVDMRFAGHLPPIHSLLRAGDKGHIVIEVQSQRDAQHVRGIALTPTAGLARGTVVQDTGGPLKAPVGKALLSRMFDVFGRGRGPPGRG
jgi:F-type H+-transporting ATPase subunit beta